jgi:hypothetical protein
MGSEPEGNAEVGYTTAPLVPTMPETGELTPGFALGVGYGAKVIGLTERTALSVAEATTMLVAVADGGVGFGIVEFPDSGRKMTSVTEALETGVPITATVLLLVVVVASCRR